MYYHRLGNTPPKRHTQFRQPDGSLYKEEVVSSEGFSDTFRPLHLTTDSLEFPDKNYPMSWTDHSGEFFNEVNTP